MGDGRGLHTLAPFSTSPPPILWFRGCREPLRVLADIARSTCQSFPEKYVFILIFPLHIFSDEVSEIAF